VRDRGFTLLEVVLALSIALGLLVVVLYYYQQASVLRDSILRSTAGLAAVRLCLDRLGTELRTASGQPGDFRGGPQEIEFLHCDLPEPANAVPGEVSTETEPRFPLRRIRYALSIAGEASDDSGLLRTEEFVAVTPPAAAAEDQSFASPGAPPDLPPDTNDVWAAESATEVDEGTRLTTSFPSAGVPALTIPELRYLRLRYWDGAAWQESWSASTLPRGVEITLALEALPDDAAPESLPAEVFRRVIALPTGLATSPAVRADEGIGETEFDPATTREDVR
jgi:prepilin-type N-terminal cleavage/methylation domain-containing protein